MYLLNPPPRIILPNIKNCLLEVFQRLPTLRFPIPEPLFLKYQDRSGTLKGYQCKAVSTSVLRTRLSIFSNVQWKMELGIPSGKLSRVQYQ